MNVLILCLAAIALDPWQSQEGGTKARLRGVSAVNREVAWASGSGGTCLRTVDGGATWKAVAAPGDGKLDFRDVHAVDDRTAYLLSIGEGELSRIFKTTDGGVNWSLSYRNRDPKGFLDAIAFFDADHGLALGDPVDGRYVILATDDGGKAWAKIPPEGMPAALPGEGAFAASGTCLVVLPGGKEAWFATGGGATSRVFRSADRGRTWAVADCPIRAGVASAGVFGLAFRDGKHGVAVGGDYRKVDGPGDFLATTDNGGETWSLAGRSPHPGFRSAVAYIPGSLGPRAVAVGPSGWDLSADGGRTWPESGPGGFHALSFGATARAGWGVGEGGRILRFDPVRR